MKVFFCFKQKMCHKHTVMSHRTFALSGNVCPESTVMSRGISSSSCMCCQKNIFVFVSVSVICISDLFFCMAFSLLIALFLRCLFNFCTVCSVCMSFGITGPALKEHSGISVTVSACLCF